MPKRKNQRPLNKQKWNKQIKIYHNKGSEHFLLVIAERGDYVCGHDLTTHPVLNSKGQPKKKYISLCKNPNPKDLRVSYLNKHLRKNIRKHFIENGRKRLTLRKKWKLSKKDKKYVKRIDRKKI